MRLTALGPAPLLQRRPVAGVPPVVGGTQRPPGQSAGKELGRQQRIGLQVPEHRGRELEAWRQRLRAVGGECMETSQQQACPSRPRRQVPQPIGQPRRIPWPRRHELDVAIERLGQLQGQVGRTHPHPLAQLGQPAEGQGPAPAAPDLGRAPRRGDHGQPPVPVVGGGGTGAAGRLPGLARREMARQAVPTGPVGRRLTAGHHAAQRHPGPVLADAEQVGQAHELGHRQLGRIHAEQRAGQDGSGRQRQRRFVGPGPTGRITLLCHLTNRVI